MVQSILFKEKVVEGTACQPNVVCCQRVSHADAALEHSEPSLQDPKGALHVFPHPLQPLGPPSVSVGPAVFERRDHARSIKVAVVARQPDAAELAVDNCSVAVSTKQGKGVGWQHTTAPHACCKVVKPDKRLVIPSSRMTSGGVEDGLSVVGSEVKRSGGGH